jgi:hypothetical protein
MKNLASDDRQAVMAAREVLLDAGEVGALFLRKAVRESDGKALREAATLLAELSDAPSVALVLDRLETGAPAEVAGPLHEAVRRILKTAGPDGRETLRGALGRIAELVEADDALARRALAEGLLIVFQEWYAKGAEAYDEAVGRAGASERLQAYVKRASSSNDPAVRQWADSMAVAAGVVVPVAQRADGMIVFEVEQFHGRTIGEAGHRWMRVEDGKASGDAALQAQPIGKGSYNTGYADRSPRLDYHVQFGRTGSYFVWIRGKSLPGGDAGSSDSLHVGLDGKELEMCDRISGFGSSYGWSRTTMDGNAPAVFTIHAPGKRVLNIWMREDGFTVDKVLLTTLEGYRPR